MSAGKGSKPRNCFSNSFKTNYDNINWLNKEPRKEIRNFYIKKGKKIYKYP
jgi:hypothetical protein